MDTISENNKLIITNMAKRLTCAEIILGISKPDKGYPILIQIPCSDVELLCVTNQTKGWDILAFRPHGFHFNKIATEADSMTIVQLKEKYEKR